MTDISKFKAVIFDMDGTLYDQYPLRRTIARRFIAAYWSKPVQGFRALRVLRAYRNAHEELRGRPYSAEIHLNLAAQKSGAPISQVREIVGRWMEAEPLDLLASCVYSDAPRLLQTLADRGIPCGVFSDYPAINKLKAMKLSHFFSAVSSANEIGFLKPDPRGLLAVLKNMGVQASDALYIGDRKIDQDAAIQAGMKVALIQNASSYSELLREFSAQSEI